MDRSYAIKERILLRAVLPPITPLDEKNHLQGNFGFGHFEAHPPPIACDKRFILLPDISRNFAAAEVTRRTFSQRFRLVTSAATVFLNRSGWLRHRGNPSTNKKAAAFFSNAAAVCEFLESLLLLRIDEAVEDSRGSRVNRDVCARDAAVGQIGPVVGETDVEAVGLSLKPPALSSRP